MKNMSIPTEIRQILDELADGVEDLEVEWGRCALDMDEVVVEVEEQEEPSDDDDDSEENGGLAEDWVESQQLLSQWAI